MLHNEKEDYMKNEDEKYYFNLLKEYYKEKFNNFVKGESPDFQNTKDDIGVEIVEAIEEENAKRHSFYEKAFKCKNQTDVAEQSDKVYNGKYKEDIVYNGSTTPIGCCHVEAGDVSSCYGEKSLYSAIEKKLKKFNKYRKFKTNTLFVISNHVFWKDILKVNYQQNIIAEIKKLEKEYSCKFDEYIFVKESTPIQLYIITANYEWKQL